MIFTDVHTDRQKLDVILGIKVVQFWSYQKMYFTKNVVLNWYSSVKKKFRKIRMIFDIENWLWKSDLGTFWRPLWTSVKVKSKNYFHFTDFFAKIKPLLTHVWKTPPLRSHYCGRFLPKHWTNESRQLAENKLRGPRTTYGSNGAKNYHGVRR